MTHDTFPTTEDKHKGEAPRIPPVALARLAGWQAQMVWANGLEVVTWQLSAAQGAVRYLKVARLGQEVPLGAERERMIWAAPQLPVPRVLDYGADATHEWLLTAGLEGVSAIDEGVLAAPRHAVPLLAQGLRRFHAVPVERCPFDSRVEAMLRMVGGRVGAGLVDPERDFQPEHQTLTAAAALTRLIQLRPKDEDLVVCHGDYCPPNVVLKDGQISGYVDLGQLGVADRWWDLAVATWAITWNFGPGWEDLFLTTYGVPRDPDKTAFYRLLHDLCP
jgi:aminoglycoside phosphotransferase